MKKIILIGLVLILLTSFVSADTLYYNDCSSTAGWQDNSGMTITTKTSAINQTSLSFYSPDGKIMSPFWNPITEPFNVSFKMNITADGDDQFRIAIGHDTIAGHWYDGASFLFVGGGTHLQTYEPGAIATNIIPINDFSQGKYVNITVEFYEATGSPLHYNVFSNKILVASAVETYTQSIGTTNRNQIGSVSTIVSDGAGGQPTIFIDDIKVINKSINTIIQQDTLNISSVNPNNLQFNTNTININTTVDSTYDFNCRLYINNTLNDTNYYTAGNNIDVSFDLTAPNNNYEYFLSCYNATSFNDNNENSSTQNFYLDSTNPILLVNDDTYWTMTYNLNITAIDDNLYSLMINDSCGYNNYTIGSITNFDKVFDISTCGLGEQTTNITLCDGFISELNCISETYTWNSMGRLNITALSLLTDNLIQNFSIYTNGLNIKTTNTGSLIINNLSQDISNFSIDSFGYELGYKLIEIVNNYQSYQFNLYTTNSININIFDEQTGNKITENVSIIFSSDSDQFTNITSTGSFYIDYLDNTEYQISFSADNYDVRIYTVTVGNKTAQNLNAYLAANTSKVLFTVSDTDTSEILSGALVSMYTYINGSWETIESKDTDITGRVQFSYIEDINYKFYISKSGYQDYIFYLNPILFTEYDIKIIKTTLINYSQDYDNVNIIYAPNYFIDDSENSFNWIISSTSGYLIDYGIMLTFEDGSILQSTGNNAIGSQLNINFNLSDSSVYDVVKLDYYYISTVSSRKNFTLNIPINVNITAEKNTFMSNTGNTFGLGIFTRVALATMVVLFIVGISTMVGQTLPGFVLGLFAYGYMAYIGFIPLWLILPSILVGLIFMNWLSGG